QKHLRRAGRNEGGRRVRSERIRIGQPDVQRKHSGLQRQSRRDECSGDHDWPESLNLTRTRRHVGEVQRAGHHVHETDADKVEGGAERSQHEVPERGEECLTSCSSRDQDIATEGGDLHEYENVEHVAGHENAGEAGRGQEPRGVEQVLPFGGNLAIERGAREEERYARCAGDHEKQQRGKAIDDELNPPGCRPGTYLVGQHAVAPYERGQLDDQEEREQRRRGGRRPRETTLPEQGGERGGQQQGRGRKHRKMNAPVHHSLSMRASSLSSVVPYASLIRTTIARPSASVEIPTTIAVSIKTWGSGFE